MSTRVLLLLGILISAPALHAAETPEPDPELKQFMGSWSIAAMTEGGKDVKDKPKSIRFTDTLALPKEGGFLGYVFTVELPDGGSLDRAYVITSSKTPKELMLLESKIAVPFTTIAAPSGRRGTYIFGKDTLTIYLAAEGKDLPKDLDKKSEGLLVLELRRATGR